MTRSVWEKVPFDEETTNIEDRIWAREILNQGYEIIYEPEASVYHWHGIHQDGNRERLRNVVKIVESLDLVTGQAANRGDPKKLNIVALIPKKGESLELNERTLLSYTIERALQAELIDEVVVSTDSEKTADLARSQGADVPFIRPKDLSQDFIGLNRVMSYSISQLQMLGRFADLVIILQETNPFRPKGFLDALIREALYTGVDTLIPVRRDYRMFFKKEEEELVAIDSGLIPQKFKDPLFAGIAGLGMVVKPGLLLDERLTGKSIGIFPVSHRLSTLDIENKEDAAHFGELLKTFWESDE
jgi:CMP-N-acetylneuraminic acid synthetase